MYYYTLLLIDRVVIPYYQKKNRKAAMWYLDTTMVRGNPSVVDDLLDSEYVGREFKNVRQLSIIMVKGY